jgi:putative ABC transport system permease protein
MGGPVSATRTELLTLLGRQFGKQRSAAAVIMVTVAGIAFLTAATPHAMEDLSSRELAFSISGLPASARDLSASPVGIVSLTEGDTVDDVWGAPVRSAQHIRETVPTTARTMLGDPQIVASTNALSTSMSDYPLGQNDPLSHIGLVAGPDLLDQVTFVAGEAPAAADHETALALRPGRRGQSGESATPVDIALSVAAAEKMNWPIGQVRKASPEATNQAPSYVLTGTFEALDSSADYWQHLPSTTLVVDIFDDGNRRPTATATAIVSPLTWPAISAYYGYGANVIQRLTVWYPLDATAITGANAIAVRDELRQTAARVVPIGDDSEYADAPRSAFSTAVVDRLDLVLGRSDATTSVLLVAASGPLGVAIAVLALASRLIAQRRRDTLSLVASRGGSDMQLRGVLAAEGLVYGVPSAVFGAVLGLLVVSGSPTPAIVLGVAIAAIAPAVVLALSATPGSLRRARSDIATAPRTRTRRAVDLVITALAVAAVAVITVRGPTASGIDPLLVVAPVLVSVAASLWVLRLYPLPMRVAERLLSRRDTAAALLGAVRSSRDPAAGLAPVLAMIVAVSIAAFAGTMVATLSAGTLTAAQESTGGDVRLAGPQFTDDMVTAVRALDGVADVSPIEVIGSGTLTANRKSIPIEIIVADTTALAAQQSGLGGGSPVVQSTTDDAQSGVVSESLAAKISPDDELSLGSHPLTIVGTSAAIAGSGADHDWVLIDISQRDLLARDGFAPRVLVVTTTSDAGTTAVLDWAKTTYGTGVQTATMATALNGIYASPFVTGLSTALLVVILVVALLCVFCVVLMTTIGAAERARLLALLRTLGFSRTQARTLIAWELGPVAVVALAAGGALGLALPMLVLAGIDVTPFTGGVRQPSLVVDPATLAATAVGFAAIAVAATLIAIRATRESPIAEVLRSGEE